MVTFYRSRCDGGAYIDWDLTDPNDTMFSESMAAELRGYDGANMVRSIFAARRMGEYDREAEYRLFLALYPKQQMGQTRKSY